MNSMVNNMFGGDPFGSAFGMISPLGPAISPMSRLMSSSLMPALPNPMHMSNMANVSHMPQSYYCSSSVMSMSTGVDGRPQIYESSHSTLAGPGGLKETRSSMRDSRTGMQKMSIGHHIEDRAHVVEKARNHYTGEEEHNDEYINIEEEEGPQFDNEFKQRMNLEAIRGLRGRHMALHSERHRSPQLALPAPPTRHEARPVSAQSSHKSGKHHKMSSKKHLEKKMKKPYKKSA